MSDRPEGVLVRMLHWINSGVGRLLEPTGRTEQQVGIAQLAIAQIISRLDRIEERLDDIQRRQVGIAQLAIAQIISRVDRIEEQLDDIQRRLPPTTGVANSGGGTLRAARPADGKLRARFRMREEHAAPLAGNATTFLMRL